MPFYGNFGDTAGLFYKKNVWSKPRCFHGAQPVPSYVKGVILDFLTFSETLNAGVYDRTIAGSVISLYFDTDVI